MQIDEFGDKYTSMVSLLAQTVNNLPAMQDASVQSMGQEDLLEMEWLLTRVFLPGEFHGQRSLASTDGVAKSQTQLNE